ncbi:MAG TPA: deubiquitinase [Bradyrhizobium sp.]|nr:deubiquitinase [Bradyrhizobium sp.]
MDSLLGNLKVKSAAAFRFATGRLSRLALTKGSIRAQILIFCLAMSAVAVALGGYSILGIRHAGDLVAKTFDESLMSINYARAAGADFASMRVASSQRLLTTDPDIRAGLDSQIEKLAKTLSEDLTIAADRSQSSRAAQAAAKVQEAADAWMALHRRAIASSVEGNSAVDPHASGTTVGDVDRYSRIVSQQVELLVNYTAGDGFLFRQKALSTIKRDLQLNVAGLTVALFLSALFSWLLARRIIGPVAIASRAARSIAGGDLDATVPKGGTDELGTLLTAMETMRDNIRRMVDREVSQRRSAQARLSDALETSPEGVVLLDADGQIALANSRASEFIRLSPQLLQSDRLDAPSLAPADGDNDGFASEARLSDGRWLRVSRSETQEGGVVLVYSDISTLKQQKAELHETNLRLDAALTHMSQGLCMFDADGRIMLFNERYSEIMGRNRVPLQGRLLIDVLQDLHSIGEWDGDPTEFCNALVAEARAGNGATRIVNRNDRAIRVVDQPMKGGGWVATFEDITEWQQAQEQISHMARHDALTNLPNRTLFREQLEKASRLAKRTDQVAVLCLDLDHFKEINDTLGHPIGDALLREVARRLGECVTEHDTVARLGGDEFAIVQFCSNCEPSVVSSLASYVVERIAAPYEIEGHQLVIGVSIGISLAPEDGKDPDELLQKADLALYRAKADGRGTYRFFETGMDARAQARRLLERDLRLALEHDEFEVYYQPIRDVEGDRVVAFEALARWNHGLRGLIAPNNFIPVAEETGLIVPLGEIVLRKACFEAAGWPADIAVAVNLSPVQFKNPNLVSSVRAALDASGLSPDRLELEITESVLLQNSEATLAVLHELRGFGVRISLDDFGTGYSSLSYLRSFPFDKIKIDRSFVTDLATREDSMAIVRAVTGLGKSLGIVTTAEGVETDTQFDLLRREGCTQAQGYLFSPPRPAADVAKMLRRAPERSVA